jgi:cyclase
MKNIRIIPKLEVKGENLIKGVHLEGLRVVGKPEEAATRYYNDGADELIYIDLVASLYQRVNFLNIVERTARKIFIPLTVGGGIRTLDDVKMALRSGADKVALNTQAIKTPGIISEIANAFGSQCVVLSMEVQRKLDGTYECYTDMGRTSTGQDPFAWAKETAKLGAGEILVTSINQDGTGKGFDLELIKGVATKVQIPVIACGGAGKKEHFKDVIEQSRTDAVAASTILHFKKIKISQVKDYLNKEGIGVRLI